MIKAAMLENTNFCFICSNTGYSIYWFSVEIVFIKLFVVIICLSYFNNNCIWFNNTYVWVSCCSTSFQVFLSYTLCDTLLNYDRGCKGYPNLWQYNLVFFFQCCSRASIIYWHWNSMLFLRRNWWFQFHIGMKKLSKN